MPPLSCRHGLEPAEGCSGTAGGTPPDSAATRPPPGGRRTSTGACSRPSPAYSSGPSAWGTVFRSPCALLRLLIQAASLPPGRTGGNFSAAAVGGGAGEQGPEGATVPVDGRRLESR